MTGFVDGPAIFLLIKIIFLKTVRAKTSIIYSKPIHRAGTVTRITVGNNFQIPQSGLDSIKEIDVPWPPVDKAHHHEHLDGKGYFDDPEVVACCK